MTSVIPVGRSREHQARRRYYKPTPGITTLRDVYLRCQHDQGSGCWEWQGAVSNGRPRLWMFDLALGDKLGVPGPRGLWYLVHRQLLPKGHMAWMRCHRALCMCPQHLTSGTRSQYFQALADRGLSRFGEATPGRLSSAAKGRAARGMTDTPPELVRRIVQLAEHEPRNVVIARQTGVSLSTIGRILTGQAFRDITGLPPRPPGRGHRRSSTRCAA